MTTDDSAPDTYTELDDKGQALLLDYRQARDAAAMWEVRRKELGKELLAALGDANKGTVGGQHVCTVVAAIRDTFEVERFKAAMPDLYNDFVVPKQTAASIRLAGAWAK